MLHEGNITRNTSLPVTEKCRIALDLSLAGKFDDARNAMSGVWSRIGEKPNLDGLTTSVRAEVLLRTGALAGWLGSSRQIEGAQEFAKDLISESLTLFTEFGDCDKQAEAQVDLGICYWRQGAIEEATAMYQGALDLAQTGLQRARALMNLAVLYIGKANLLEALPLLNDAAGIFERGGYTDLHGRNSLQLSLVYKRLFVLEGKEDYLDLALMKATEASIDFDRTGNKRDEAIVENNLGNLYMVAGRPIPAHTRFERARRLFEILHDRVNVARVDDSRALLFLQQGHLAKAEAAASMAVRALEVGEEHAVLAEVLITYGKALARSRRYRESQASLSRAIAEAEIAGDRDSAGAACLTMIEELTDQLNPSELITTYRRADAFLERNEGQECFIRLRRCARLVLQTISHLAAVYDVPPTHAMNLQDRKHLFLKRFEELEIKRALALSNGEVTAAARHLGISHQTLGSKMDRLKTELTGARKEKQVRHRSIIPKK